MRYMVLIILLVFYVNANANGGSGKRNVSNVKIEGASFIAVYSDTAWDNPDNCGNSNLAIILLSDKLYREKLSVALAAFIGQKKLNLWLTACQKTPWGYTAPIIHTMSISD